MNMYFGYIFVCLVLLQVSESKLTSLIIVHRHADRTPVVTYPYDIYTCVWTEGYGILIDEGVERMIDFGKLLRQRYGDFWPEKDDLDMESSRVDRVIKSLEHLLEGVYSDKFLLKPVQLLARPTSQDKMLYPITTDCPKFTEELAKVFKEHKNVKWFKSLQPFFDYLTQNSGQEFELTASDRLQIINFQDVHLVHKYFNLTFPNWMKEADFNKLTEAAVYQMRLNYNNKILQRLPAGLIFNELRKQVDAIKKGDFKKVRLFSTHDVKIAAILMGLQAFNDRLPPYGSMVIFEYYREENEIKSFYLNDTATGTFHPLKIPDCDNRDSCTFEQFYTLTKELIPVNDNWYQDCKEEESL